MADGSVGDILTLLNSRDVVCISWNLGATEDLVPRHEDNVARTC